MLFKTSLNFLKKFNKLLVLIFTGQSNRRPAAPELGGLQLLNMESYPKNLKTWSNLSYYISMILSQITYHLSPKIKSMPTVYVSVSKLPPPLLILYTPDFLLDFLYRVKCAYKTYGQSFGRLQPLKIFGDNRYQEYFTVNYKHLLKHF